MTARDLVAVILAGAVAVVVILVVWATIILGRSLTADAVVGGIVGAMIVTVARYLADDRKPR